MRRERDSHPRFFRSLTPRQRKLPHGIAVQLNDETEQRTGRGGRYHRHALSIFQLVQNKKKRDFDLVSSPTPTYETGRDRLVLHPFVT